ncbi:hypothetical protein DFJ73DRAFT_960729 [Zopfochytrium polystomum]|nr:hypothetical protein DFJ73DRAFT_960729 [Zopfochytrium polystomum]
MQIGRRRLRGRPPRPALFALARRPARKSSRSRAPSTTRTRTASTLTSTATTTATRRAPSPPPIHRACSTLPLQLSMLWDSGDPDANHGWFAVVRDRVTGEEVALANGKAGDGETAILWTSEAHLERYQPWGDVPTSLWSRQIFQRNGKFFPDGGRGWLSKLRRPAKNEAEQREWDRILELERAAKVFSSVWFCGDSELERLVAVAANILEDDLPDANVPHEMFPVLWRAFLREAFKGTWFENLPLTTLDVVALNLKDPVVYTKALV